MKTTGFCRLGLATLAVAMLSVAVAGCESTPTKEELRPGTSDLVVGDQGMQSKDLVQMTDKMAPDLLKIPEIVQNPNKIVIVMKPITNHLEDQPGRDLTIYVARLRALLNEHARDRLAFVEEKKTTEALQAAEGAGNTDVFEEGSRGPGQPPTRIIPQYVLTGEFYSKTERATTYYFCEFHLTNLKTGVIVWNGHYDVRTLNY